MKKLLSFFVLAIISIALSSCATIFTKSRYPITFNTNPEGATISIENRAQRVIYEGISPATVTLKAAAGYMKREEYKITITKDGYNPKVILITPNLDGWYIGNILLGGVIGMLIVDPASGAMYKIAKEDRLFNETLTPTSKDLSLQIYDIENLPSHISKDSLVSIN